jgi:hypothetical protein
VRFQIANKPSYACPAVLIAFLIWLQGTTRSEERNDLAGQQDKPGQQQQHGLLPAAAAAAAAPPPQRVARAATTCKFSINTDSGNIIVSGLPHNNSQELNVIRGHCKH